MTYALALVALLPARVVLPAALAPTGTVWNGAAAIGGGNVVEWRWSLLDTLGNGAFAANWTLDGPGTALTGAAVWQAEAPRATRIDGRAAWALLARAVPALPQSCTVTLHIRGGALARDRFAGELTTDAGVCGAAATPVPRLIGTATDDGAASRLTLTPWSARATALADIVLTRSRRLTVDIHPAGAALFGAGTARGRIATQL